MTSSVSDFDVAKNIADQLKDLDKLRQQRVLRWVAESLGIQLSLKPDAEIAGSLEEPERPPLDQSLRHSQRGPVDIRTFVDSRKPKNDVQFATVIAYYYRFEASPENRKETIDAKILQEAARLSNHKRLTSPLTTLNNAKTLGYLDAPTRGQFQINSVGENLVAMTLPGGEGARTRRTSTRRRKKPAKR